MAVRTRAVMGALLALALSSQLHAATALNILFIGNSITYYNSGLDVVCARFHQRSNHSNPRMWAQRICRRQAYQTRRSLAQGEEIQLCCHCALVLRHSPVTGITPTLPHFA